MATKTRFRAFIERLAQENSWNISELHDEEAVVEYELAAEAVYSLFFSLQGEVIEIAVPSEAVFDDDDEIPHEASTMLLRRNLQTEAGFWAMDEFDGQLCYTLIQVETLETLEEYDSAELADLVCALVEEVDEFNDIWEEEDF